MSSETDQPLWTRTNRFLNALRAPDQVPTAMWVKQPWHGSVEVLGAVGADAVIIDLEHTFFSMETVERLVVACEAAGVTPIVRAPRVDSVVVSQILDLGAQGLIFPKVETAEQARAAVAATRFAPRGSRGWSGSHNRTALYLNGKTSDAILSGADPLSIYNRSYIAQAEDVFVEVMIESVEGVNNIEEIAAVEGIDAILFGFGDFSLQVDLNFEKCQAASKLVYETAERHGKGRPIHLTDLASVPETTGFSGRYVDCGVDTGAFAAALSDTITAARKVIEETTQQVAKTSAS